MGADESTDHIEPGLLSKRGSFYNYATSRTSLYDTQSLEYNPRPASSHYYVGNNSNPRLSGHGYSQLTGANASYSDVRKSNSLVGEREVQQSNRDSYRPTSNYGPLRHLDEYESQQRQVHAGSGYGRQYANQNVGSGMYGSGKPSQGHQKNSSSVRERSKGRPHSRVISQDERNEKW